MGQSGWSAVRNIGGTRVLVPGHQNSGAPTFFFGVFLMVFSNLCWQCSNKTRKCQEHINTLRKKEKLIFLMPILEIKTKNLFSAGKGTRVLVPGHQNSGAPSFFGGISWWCNHICAGNVLIKPRNVRKTCFNYFSRLCLKKWNWRGYTESDEGTQNLTSAQPFWHSLSLQYQLWHYVKVKGIPRGESLL